MHTTNRNTHYLYKTLPLINSYRGVNYRASTLYLGLRKTIIHNFLFFLHVLSWLRAKITEINILIHNFSMWNLDLQNNENVKRKKNSLIGYIKKNQKIALTVPNGSPRMTCLLHISRRGPIQELGITVILCSLNQSRETSKCYTICW